MGGYGSTRWGAVKTRQDTDRLLRLDVRWLKRQGALEPGAVARPHWTNSRGEPAGNITTRMNRDGDYLILDYRIRRPGEANWTPRTEHVSLETTPCHLGGKRTWFTCPGCRSRRAVLFSVDGIFRCRACHGLAYSSTRDTEIDRATRRIWALQRKLGAPAGCDIQYIPGKPAHMHWTTYERHKEELHAAIRQREALFDSRFTFLPNHVHTASEGRKSIDLGQLIG